MDINIWKVSQSPRFFNDQENEDLFKRNCVCVHPDTNAKGASSTTQGEDFSNVKKGDFFYLCYGNKCIRLFGMFTGESQECKLAGKSDWLEQKYELYFESRSNDKYQGSPAWWTPSDNSTFTRCKNNEEFQEWILKPFFSKTLKDIEMMTNNEEYLCLLKNNNNLILTGAPGTGKTYLAKQIAAQMILDGKEDEETKKNKMNEQCGFVQFHPSYDYTDFVEGLRPVQDSGVGFEQKDGVFKIFCKKALKNFLDSKKTIATLSQQSSIEEKYECLISKIENGEIAEIPLKSKNSKMLIVKVSDYRNIILKAPGSLSTTTYTVSLKRILKLSEKYPNKESLERITNISTEIRETIGGCNASAYWGVLYKIYEQTESVEKIQDAIHEKKYVFIIDEINRGEISKIFGELFFSIDPGYRGVKGQVRTQYANMQKEEANDFDDALGITDPENYGHFFVPENVYIIGTMNDIDRSVESMDFAFRRRFAFKEITAEYSKQMLDSGDAWGKDENDNSREPDQTVIEAIKNKMNAINNIIWHNAKEGEKEDEKSIDGLSSAYHIGASYFLKLVNYKKDDGSYNYDQLWETHLEGLLFEYMRGMVDVQKRIKRLAKAFGYSNLAKYE